SDAIELMPREQTALEILETVEPRRGGGALSPPRLGRFPPCPGRPPVRPCVRETVPPRPDRDGRPGPLARRQACGGDSPASAYPVKLLAEKVETREQFRRYLDLGCHYFQGYYFARPAVLERRRVIESSGIFLKMLRLLAQDADIRELELAFR
ncbi:MAG TPA: EAL domain-containing protein, partial [Anaeromyxobacteraceae bacterium]|nr:EAL domain-containing protein [Anaeromyxobacteraceae bacterium]